jgi:hypothetical protein
VSSRNPILWSLVALALGIAGGLADWLVVVPTGPETTTLVWPLAVLPLFFVPLPLLIPAREARVAAAVLMLGWCAVATLSFGPLLYPCLVAMFLAAKLPDAAEAEPAP